MVTNDSGTQDAIRRVLDEFHQYAAQLGHNFQTNARVIDRDSFRTQTQINPP